MEEQSACIVSELRIATMLFGNFKRSCRSVAEPATRLLPRAPVILHLDNFFSVLIHSVLYPVCRGQNRILYSNLKPTFDGFWCRDDRRHRCNSVEELRTPEAFTQYSTNRVSQQWKRYRRRNEIPMKQVLVQLSYGRIRK